MLAISACLGGICCRYDGKNNTVAALQQLVADKKAIVVCPEVLGGLPTPRTPSEIVGGDGFDVWQGNAQVVTKTGENVTAAFKAGAIQAYQELKKHSIDYLVLKANSPSCGSQLIYDGSFSGIKKADVGVATAYFISQGLQVITEEEWLVNQER
ncbi:uncharacterized protein YbbK (DUF523 family) [Enterococcus sp. PF1-24]|uniref:DUF523 domain-containing protein n=1 Tax=unclassified Enterococcus TaxID=2608891 RepID=UPI0024753998|nr:MULTISPECIES: DUF523 domain-containing protein [unclassified Enterococcus]MDH6364155.1 uncharacterized protein YbbK (DUF523 family) [Enterococcus sp. PFB1-1]MDH6401256.1 uncharacterized protein YbbK (DUF523 family) [Enterococcus sp. PF1-24]